ARLAGVRACLGDGLAVPGHGRRLGAAGASGEGQDRGDRDQGGPRGPDRPGTTPEPDDPHAPLTTRPGRRFGRRDHEAVTVSDIRRYPRGGCGTPGRPRERRATPRRGRRAVPGRRHGNVCGMAGRSSRESESGNAPERDGRRHVAIVGGGIAGLAAAWYLGRDGGDRVRVTVLEGADRVGGKLRVSEVAGVPVDEGAEAMLAARPEGRELAQAAGLGDELVDPGVTSSLIYS